MCSSDLCRRAGRASPIRAQRVPPGHRVLNRVTGRRDRIAGTTGAVRSQAAGPDRGRAKGLTVAKAHPGANGLQGETGPSVANARDMATGHHAENGPKVVLPAARGPNMPTATGHHAANGRAPGVARRAGNDRQIGRAHV